MGEKFEEFVEDNLAYVSESEFNRVLALDCSPEAKAALLSDLCRLNALYLVASAGSGHLGTSFSSMDLIVWAKFFFTEKLEECGERVLFFSSKGHDAPAMYSAQYANGEIAESQWTRFRRLGGLPGHPDVRTHGVATNTGSLGMGISKAKGFVEAARLRGEKIKVLVLCGDGELQEGQVWEALLRAGTGYPEIALIIDHNKLQSDTFVNEVSDLGEIEKKFEAFDCRVSRIDGHDFVDIRAGFEAISSKSTMMNVLIADTIKGSGVSFMECPQGSPLGERYPFHSGSLTNEQYIRAFDELSTRINLMLSTFGMAGPRYTRIEKAASTPSNDRSPTYNLVAAYEDAILEIGAENESVVVLDADLRHDLGVDSFARTFPNRFFECGIAEQDMVSQAGTMALSGLVPVVHSFSSFLTSRANEQIYNNSSESSRIVYVGGLSGLIPSAPGHSHQSLRDIALMASMPNMVVVTPGRQKDVAALLRWAVYENPGSTFIRLTSGNHRQAIAPGLEGRISPGCGIVLQRGLESLVVASGPYLTALALEASSSSDRLGYLPSVVDICWMNVLETEWWEAIISRHRKLVILHDYQIKGTSIPELMQTAMKTGIELGNIHLVGPDGLPVGGQNEEVLDQYGLNLEKVSELLVIKD